VNNRRAGQPALPPKPAAEQEPGLWDRRDFMIASGAAVGIWASLSAAMGTANAASAPPRLFHAIVADTRFPESRAFAHKAARAGNRIVWITGDITDLWYNELDLLWREKKATLAGLTGYAAIFCLERLAWDRGLRVTFKEEHRRAGSGGPDLLYRWIIAPKPRNCIQGDAA